MAEPPADVGLGAVVVGDYCGGLGDVLVGEQVELETTGAGGP
ncbi:MAG: hypothetical protein OXG67_04835 [bacterium]|nr:hypothetical protein [bacterium]MCY3889136.1 hypothetical protein [bacterium]